ncbi:uncharacterized protein V1516DRAFT_629707 [Lipomyces oligophaga]|uniref:uncharacterized protein n=1 Tax=Lipomyces oligophaga TaxID=45792 RepID=UPI0034CF2D5A
MSAVTLLTADLSSLLSESKRRQTDLRQACETSFAELKGLTPSGRSESDIISDLARSKAFIRPFSIACTTNNVKQCNIGLQGIQHIVTFACLNPDTIDDLLASLQDAVNFGVDVQLKVLQVLPPLIEKYGYLLRDERIARAIKLCSTMQSSKTAVVANTAAATLQQLSITVFDEVITEDGQDDLEATDEAPTDEGRTMIKIKPAAYDAFRIFQDICLLTEGGSPKFIALQHISEGFGLELMESIIANHANIFNTHPEQTYILRTFVFPYILRSLSERREFPIVVRVIRILYLILRRHLAIVPVECEVALTLLIHTLEPDVGPYWKRILVMEVFQGVFAEYPLVRKFYSEYDSQEGRQPILHRLITALNKLSGEKPHVIGLRRLSSLFFNAKESSNDTNMLDSSPVAGLLGSSVGMSNGTDSSGLSIQSSSVRVLCIDQLDKAEPPALPDTYIYLLALNCINSFADGMTRFLLPLSLSEANSSTKRKSAKSEAQRDSPKGESPPPTGSLAKGAKRRTVRYRGAPINPLSLEEHALYPEIVLTSKIVQDCWPPLLAGFSTFLYARLDSDLYHNLVRSFQKFTQSAGLLQLATPRDAFLTTLAKVAIPSQIFTGPQSQTGTQHERHGYFNSAINLSVESFVTGGIRENASMNADGLYGTLHVRNLLCLRALLNLAIALGPTLKESWAIVLEALQQADLILHSTGSRFSRQQSTPSKSDLASSGNTNTVNSDSLGLPNSASLVSEVSAVDNAVRKLIDCTREFPDDSFLDLINAFCKLSSSTIGLRSQEEPMPLLSPTSSTTSIPDEARQPLSRSNSIVSTMKPTYGNPLYAIIKMGEIADINVSRLVYSSPDISGWDALVSYYNRVSACRGLESSIRMKAAEALNSIILAAIVEVSAEQPVENLGKIQKRCLIALEEEIYAGLRQGLPPVDMELTIKISEAEIQSTALDTLHDILDRTGSLMTEGWDLVFSVITSVFVMHNQGSLLSTTKIPDGVPPFEPLSPGGKPGHSTKAESEKISRLVKAAFGSLQLICNDFLSSIPQGCFIELVDLLYYFCHQTEDLNISFTTITFFWTVSDFLRSKLTESGLNSDLSKPLRSRDELLNMARSGDLQDSTSSLWLVLLLRLTIICADSRAEVRNGAIQILFRIFDSYGSMLGVNSWSACLWIVIYTVMEIKPIDDGTSIEFADKAHALAFESSQKQWSESIALILSGLSRLYSTFFEEFLKQPDFLNIWHTLLNYLHELIALKRPDILVSVFKGLTDILESIIESASGLSEGSLQETWDLWCEQESLINEAENGTTGTMTQDSTLAYVNMFKPLHSLMRMKLMDVDKCRKALTIMRSAALFPELPPYFSDHEFMTPLQTAILEVVKLISVEPEPEVNSLALREFAEFSSFACKTAYATSKTRPSTNGNKKSSAKGPSYIALSVKCLEYVSIVFAEAVSNNNIFEDGALSFTLEMLSIPIQMKYKCPALATEGDSKEVTTLWMLSTNLFVLIAERAIPVMLDRLKNLEDSERIKIWKQIVQNASGIIRTNSPVHSSRIGDEGEKFDMVAFAKIEGLLIPSLGDSRLPDSLIEGFIRTMFNYSFVYKVDGLYEDREKSIDVRLSNIFDEPLLGSTETLDVLPRQNMSYACFECLFELSRIQENYTAERQRLSDATIPYLVLRCAIALHKFAADQPLRGTIPAPRLQQKELVYILKHLLELTEPKSGESQESDDKTCGDNEEAADGKIIRNGSSNNNNYKPLLKLLPLLSKSIVASKEDKVVLHLLQAFFERISTDISAI